MRKFFRPRFSGPYRSFGIRRPRMGATVYCPERDEDVTYYQCIECPQFGVWEDGDLERCKFEAEDLRSKGYYAKDQDEWFEYLHDLDPKTWQQLIEEKRNRERVLEEMEAERQGNVNQSGETENEKSGTASEKDECADEPDEEKPAGESDEDCKEEEEKQTDDEDDE